MKMNKKVTANGRFTVATWRFARGLHPRAQCVWLTRPKVSVQRIRWLPRSRGASD